MGASQFNAEYFREMYDAGAFDYVMAVDGGYASLKDAGIEPDMALGDFDSLGYIPKGIRVVRFSSHKDESDMELALKRVKSMKFDSVVVFGALGRRLDHTLANMQVFSKLSEEGLNVSAIDMDDAIFFITGPDIFEAPALESGIVSVFAMNDMVHGLFERGLEWELDNVELTNRTSLALSNEIIGEAIMIGVEEGTIAIFFPLISNAATRE